MQTPRRQAPANHCWTLHRSLIVAEQHLKSLKQKTHAVWTQVKIQVFRHSNRSRILLSLFCCIPSLDPKTKCGPFHSVTMTQSVTQPDYSACQPSNSEPSIICLAKKSGRPLLHSNSLPQTELSNKLDGLTNVQSADCSINHLFKPLFIRRTSHPSSKS